MGRLYDEPYTMQHRASDGTTLVMRVQRVGYDPAAMWEAQVHGEYNTRSWGRLRRDAIAAAADKWARLQLPPRRQKDVA